MMEKLAVAATGMILNGLVLDTIVRLGKSREAADLLVAGLALSDAILAVGVVWLTVYNLVYFQCLYECLVRLGIIHATMIASMFHLLALTLDRYLRIVMPFRYDQICQKYTVWILMAGMWITSIFIGSLPIFGWYNEKEDKLPEGENTCAYFNVMSPTYVSFLGLLVLAIITLILLFYFNLYLVSRKHIVGIKCQKSCDETSFGVISGQRPTRKDGHTWRYTKTVLLIIGVNFFCWVPSGIVALCSLTGVLDFLSSGEKGDLLLYTNVFIFINTLLNPFIYAVKLPVIRRRYRDLWKEHCYCKNNFMSVYRFNSKDNRV